MKRLLIYLASTFSFITLISTAQNRSIKFEHVTFKEIKAKALKENKLIFIDAYTSWCGPCKQMAKNVFTNDTVADYYNKNFVNAKIDMEKGEGIEIAKQYDVRCYPNLLFVDGHGKIVHRVAGGMSPKEFVALGEETKSPEKCFSYFANNYEANKTNSDFLRKYIYAKDGTCLETADLVKSYFTMQKEDELTNEDNWKMIKFFVNTMDSREFDYLMANKTKFENLYQAQEVNVVIDNIFRNSLYAASSGKTFDEKKYIDLKEKISSYGFPNTKLLLFESDMNLAANKADWSTYAKLAVSHVDEFYSEDVNALNNVAWTFYENVKEKEALEKAAAWSSKACDIESSYANLDTYAAILYKLGKKDLALEKANKAIDAAKNEKQTPEQYQGTTDLIKKINELK